MLQNLPKATQLRVVKAGYKLCYHFKHSFLILSFAPGLVPAPLWQQVLLWVAKSLGRIVPIRISTRDSF